MKVLFLSAAKSVHTVRWVNALVERNIDILLVYNRGHEENADIIDRRVKTYCLKYSGVLGYYMNANELRKIYREFDPDLVNVHYASGYGTLARISGIGPVLLSVWGSDVYDFPNGNVVKKLILKRNVRYADVLASTSNCMATQLRKIMCDKNLSIYITPFGVDTDSFSPEKWPSKQDDQEIVIANIKMLEPKYGIRQMVLAVGLMVNDAEFAKKCKKKVLLKVYGDGSQKEELKKLVKDQNLENTVIFCGKIPNNRVPEKLKESDIFCAFSQMDSESFGVAVVEAMAMELPVVVSDVDGFKEVVSNAETGYIVDRYDIVACKSALEQLALDSEKRKRMGVAGRKRVMELYCWEKNVDTMVALYRKIQKLR